MTSRPRYLRNGKSKIASETVYSPYVARLIRIHLERVALRVETLPGSKPYNIAYRHAADVIRQSKPD